MEGLSRGYLGRTIGRTRRLPGRFQSPTGGSAHSGRPSGPRRGAPPVGRGTRLRHATCSTARVRRTRGEPAPPPAPPDDACGYRSRSVLTACRQARGIRTSPPAARKPKRASPCRFPPSPLREHGFFGGPRRKP